jgi:hypothetical protein
MGETQKTPSGYDTRQIGQQFLATLTQNEIAQLLEALIGTVSTDRLSNVLDQLPPDTRHTVQTILVPPDPSDSPQEQGAPLVSLAKLEQTWSALWQEWDHIVDEAAQEDGTYIVREHHWEEPYFDSTTFVSDLERVAKQMRSLLRTAFDHEFVPATSFSDATLEADVDIMAAMPEWIYLDDGYQLGEHVTACLLEWEWLMVQEETSDVFLLAQRIREWEEESAYAKLARGTFIEFFSHLPDEQQQQIFSGLTTNKDTPLWQPVLTNTFSHWHDLYMRYVKQYAPEQYMDNLRPTISQRWENGLPVIASYVQRGDFQESLAVIEQTLASLFHRRQGTPWTPETSLLFPIAQHYYVRDDTDPHETLLRYYQQTAQGLGQQQLIDVLEIQLQAFKHCFDWQQMLQVFDKVAVPETVHQALFQSWRDYIVRLTTPDTWEFGRRQSSPIWWLHWLFDSMTDPHKGPAWFQQQLRQWLAQLPAKQGNLGAEFAFLRLLTKDAWESRGGNDTPYPHFFQFVIVPQNLSTQDDASRQEYLRQYAMDDLWDHVMAYWQGNLRHLVPKPERAEKSVYTSHAQWMAALQELAPAAYTTLLKQWQVTHKRRINLWKAMAAQGLT